MKPVSFALVLSAMLPLIPDAASAFTSRHGVKVNPVSQGVFEVIPRTFNGYLFWCAAADYAHRVLKAPWGADLHVSRGLGPSETTGRRSAVQFTLDESLVADRPVGGYASINSLAAGDSMSVQDAFGYCFVPFGPL